jgi:hypothetical protein
MLVAQGHEVVLHARNGERGKQALEKVPEAEKVLVADSKVSGRYFHHLREKYFLPEAGDPVVQEKFLDLCEEISSVGFPSD